MKTSAKKSKTVRGLCIFANVAFALRLCAVTSAYTFPDILEQQSEFLHLPAFVGAIRETVALPLPAPGPRLDPSFQQRALAFERNDGQVNAEVKFLARCRGYKLLLTSTEAVMVLDSSPGGETRSESPDLISSLGELDKILLKQERDPPGALRMCLIGANSQPGVSAEQELRGKINYFIGNDPAQWRTNISTFAQVRYREVYPGIDLVYYGNDAGRLEYDLIVAPGADPERIRLSVEGAEEVKLDASGDLILTMGGRELRWLKPKVYQERNGGKHTVISSYSLRGSRSNNECNPKVEVAFNIAPYDRNLALVIDPVLLYSTLFGGTAPDLFSDITTDEAGNLYLVGSTESSDFPLQNELQQFAGGRNDIVVTKFSPTGELIYSTYLGGAGGYEGPEGIVVDSALNAWVTGYTVSSNFPVKNAFQSQYGGGDPDAFVAKLSPEGSSLVFSSYLGGSAGDIAKGIAIDAEGNALVVGSTYSSRTQGFPVKNAFQPERTGPQNAFIAKLKPDGSIFYCTYFGAIRAYSVAVGPDGSVWFAGVVEDSNLPLKNPFQARYAGNGDGFIAKLNSEGTELLYSTYFGGSAGEHIQHLALGPEGEPYVLGLTGEASGLPRKMPLQPKPGGDLEAFIARFTPDASELVFSTYLGGRNSELPSGLDVDREGNAYVLLMTKSPDLPTVEPLFLSLQGDWDGYLAVLNPEGSKLLFASYFGGAGPGDHVQAIALDRESHIYLSGYTWADDFPLLNAQQSELKGGGDAFIAKISPVRVRPPSLQVSRVAQTLVLTWPAVGTGFVLESTDSLSLPEWLPAPAPVLIIGDQQTVVVEIEGRARFYRLRKL